MPGSSFSGRFGYAGSMYLNRAMAAPWNMRNRQYNPTLGRFMQTDPIGIAGGVNLYGYVGNDPVNAVDPTGLVPGPIPPSPPSPSGGGEYRFLFGTCWTYPGSGVYFDCRAYYGWIPNVGGGEFAGVEFASLSLQDALGGEHSFCRSQGRNLRNEALRNASARYSLDGFYMATMGVEAVTPIAGGTDAFGYVAERRGGQVVGGQFFTITSSDAIGLNFEFGVQATYSPESPIGASEMLYIDLPLVSGGLGASNSIALDITIGPGMAGTVYGHFTGSPSACGV